ncbi:MAG: hypothetical protein IJY74_04915 [Oscillospiraceae bacterium]|nr:hypothetical protein [Oscillospiraceae bacterium]
MEDKKSLLKKLHALVERGVAGEREAAEAALERLSKKYGISIDELDAELICDFEFEFHGKEEKKLLNQIAWKVTNNRFCCYDMRYSESGRKCRTHMSIQCTEAQKLEIEFLFDFYKRIWEQEKLMLYMAFIHKHDIFGDPDGNQSSTHSDFDVGRMAAMMQGLSDETPVRQITVSPVGKK